MARFARARQAGSLALLSGLEPLLGSCHLRVLVARLRGRAMARAPPFVPPGFAIIYESRYAQRSRWAWRSAARERSRNIESLADGDSE